MIKNIIFFIVLVFFASCKGGVNRDVKVSTPTSNISVYFSSQNSEIEDKIVSDIKSAKRSVKLAIYNLTDSKITDALVSMYQSGVNVEVITDDSKRDNSSVIALEDAGINVYDDEKDSALMHDKFLVIDGKIVWSGSSNYTHRSFYDNNENDIRIVDKNVAGVYLDEFDMLKNHNQTKHSYESPNLKVYFSPRGGIEDKIVNLINSANSEIEFEMYAFTSRDIADALIDKKSIGLDVKGVLDETWSDNNSYSKYDYLKDNGVDVLKDGNDYTLHDKVMIIDSSIVITGSYNYTKSANSKNAENLVVLYDSYIASKYDSEFEKIYENGE